jgi:hypothetical protein
LKNKKSLFEKILIAGFGKEKTNNRKRFLLRYN